MYRILIPEKVNYRYKNLLFLIRLSDFAASTRNQKIKLDFKYNRWIDLNLSAVLGSIVLQLEKNKNDIIVVNCTHSAQRMLHRNNFFPYYGFTSLNKISSTVPFMVFDTKDESKFGEYLDIEFFPKFADFQLDNVSRKKIILSMLEIFSNAVIHSECKSIFCCGQLYPRIYHNLHLDFTLVDIGRTIQQNVSDFFHREISGNKAIEWAVQKGNTTKTGSVPGGLGLHIMTDYLSINRGRVQIVSGDGFWQSTPARKKSIKMDTSFPGTIVNLKFPIEHSWPHVKTVENKIKDNGSEYNGNENWSF